MAEGEKVTTPEVKKAGLTRRQLIKGGLATGALGLLAACGIKPTPERPTPTPTKTPKETPTPTKEIPTQTAEISPTPTVERLTQISIESIKTLEIGGAEQTGEIIPVTYQGETQQMVKYTDPETSHFFGWATPPYGEVIRIDKQEFPAQLNEERPGVVGYEGVYEGRDGYVVFFGKPPEGVSPEARPFILFNASEEQYSRDEYPFGVARLWLDEKGEILASDSPFFIALEGSQGVWVDFTYGKLMEKDNYGRVVERREVLRSIEEGYVEKAQVEVLGVPVEVTLMTDGSLQNRSRDPVERLTLNLSEFPDAPQRLAQAVMYAHWHAWRGNWQNPERISAEEFPFEEFMARLQAGEDMSYEVYGFPDEEIMANRENVRLIRIDPAKPAIIRFMGGEQFNKFTDGIQFTIRDKEDGRLVLQVWNVSDNPLYWSGSLVAGLSILSPLREEDRVGGRSVPHFGEILSLLRPREENKGILTVGE